MMIWMVLWTVAIGCASSPACDSTNYELDCGDGIDNDGDGDIDCADTTVQLLNCSGGTGAEICTDGVGGNADGAVDCADTDCAQSLCCTVDRCLSAIVPMVWTTMPMVLSIV